MTKNILQVFAIIPPCITSFHMSLWLMLNSHITWV